MGVICADLGDQRGLCLVAACDSEGAIFRAGSVTMSFLNFGEAVAPFRVGVLVCLVGKGERGRGHTVKAVARPDVTSPTITSG